MKLLTLQQVKELQKRQLLSPHSTQEKPAGPKQDYYIDKNTGQIYVGLKHGAKHYEEIGINPRELGIPKF
ncbi:MAG: hypothetical protein AAGF11_47105 [Myxococcota bacterium]